MDRPIAQSAMVLTEQEWSDLAHMVGRHILDDETYRMAHSHRDSWPDWQDKLRRSDLAKRIVTAAG